MEKNNILQENGVEDYALSLQIANILEKLLLNKKYSEKYNYNKENTTINVEVNSFVEDSYIINQVGELLKNKENFQILCNSGNISTISIKY
jgi:hypothetical protein